MTPDAQAHDDENDRLREQVSLLERLLAKARAGEFLGVWCRSCGSTELYVVAPSSRSEGTRRTRECTVCRERAETIEVYVSAAAKRTEVRELYPPDWTRGPNPKPLG